MPDPAQSLRMPVGGASHVDAQHRDQRRLRVLESSSSQRSLWDAGTLLAFCLFIGCLALAALHAVLVQNQARLDSLIVDNQARREQVDHLLAEIAYLDSPEGVAEQAVEAGLVPAAEPVTLSPVVPGALSRPLEDPFGLARLPLAAAVEPHAGAADGAEAMSAAGSLADDGGIVHGAGSPAADARHAAAEEG